MKKPAKPVSRGVATFWCITLIAISFGIFNYTSEDRPWWLTLIAYLSAFLGFGAFLEVIRWKGTASEEKDPRKLSDEENDLIGEYATVVEKRKGLIGRESDLPASKEKLCEVLNKAKKDYIYPMALDVIEINLGMLDTFVPDEEFDSTKTLVEQTMKILEQKDEASYSQLHSNASPSQQKALKAILSIMTGTLRNLESKGSP